MPVCFFNNNYKEKYNCTYELDQDCITVHAEYDIHDEVEPVSGMISIGPNTENSHNSVGYRAPSQNARCDAEKCQIDTFGCTF